MRQLPRFLLPEDGFDLLEVYLGPSGLPRRVKVDLQVVAAGEDSRYFWLILVADLTGTDRFHLLKMPTEQLFLDTR